MRRTIIFALTLCAALPFCACSGNQTEQTNANAASTPTATPATANAAATASPSPQVVTATVEETRLDAGGAREANVTLDIAEGYHVNANPASDKFYVATEVKAEAQEGITPGKPVYPKSVTRKLSFSDKPLAVYEGRAVIKLPLRADKSAARGRHSIHATIRVQPCNDKACLQPRDIDAYIPVTIN
jgi:uncharacterized protein